jgi:hypothetical protein
MNFDNIKQLMKLNSFCLKWPRLYFDNFKGNLKKLNNLLTTPVLDRFHDSIIPLKTPLGISCEVLF